MYAGYVKLWRKSLNSGILQNHKLWVFWTWCLLKATHKPTKQMIGFQKIDLKPGQFIFGINAASIETGLSPRSVRTCVKALKNDNQIDKQTTNKFSIISIVKWETYQSRNNQDDNQTVSQVTSKRQASDNKQECKNIRINNIYSDGSEKPKVSKPKKEKKVFIPPTQDEVVQYFKEKGYSSELAIRAFEYYNIADPPWTDSKGNEVRGWKQKMNGVWLKPENKERTQQQPQRKEWSDD